MSILNKAAFQVAKLKTVDIDCPELGGTIRLQELSVGALKSVDKDDVAQQLSLMIVDENGVLQFNDAEGIQLLNQLSATVSTRLIIAAAKLNGIGQAAVDETIKNLIASPSADSVSA